MGREWRLGPSKERLQKRGRPAAAQGHLSGGPEGPRGAAGEQGVACPACLPVLPACGQGLAASPGHLRAPTGHAAAPRKAVARRASHPHPGNHLPTQPTQRNQQTTLRSPEQREQLEALLEDIYEHWVDTVAAARGKSRDDVIALLDSGVYDNKQLLEGAWVRGGGWHDGGFAGT